MYVAALAVGLSPLLTVFIMVLLDNYRSTTPVFSLDTITVSMSIITDIEWIKWSSSTLQKAYLCVQMVHLAGTSLESKWLTISSLRYRHNQLYAGYNKDKISVS